VTPPETGIVAAVTDAGKPFRTSHSDSSAPRYPARCAKGAVRVRRAAALAKSRPAVKVDSFFRIRELVTDSARHNLPKRKGTINARRNWERGWIDLAGARRQRRAVPCAAQALRRVSIPLSWATVNFTVPQITRSRGSHITWGRVKLLLALAGAYRSAASLLRATRSETVRSLPAHGPQSGCWRRRRSSRRAF
jgi:hypothetical protein